jgi:hypothetical protein
MSQKAPTCPQCGHPNKKANHLSGGETLFYLVLVAGVIWWLASDGSGSGTPKAPPELIYDAFQAQVDCETFVKKNLKAPSTAKFAPHHELTISGKDQGPWTVVGYVDAQNAFAAQVRSTYHCVVHYEDTKVYLDSLQIK